MAVKHLKKIISYLTLDINNQLFQKTLKNPELDNMKHLLFALAMIPLVLIAKTPEEGTESRQNVKKYPKVSVRKKKKIADALTKQGSFYNAVEYYEDVIKEKPDNMKVVHQLAELNRSLRDYKAAEKYYKIELDKDPKKYPNDQYFLAQMLKMNGKYDEAKKAYQDYLKLDLGKGEKSYKTLAKVDMEGCDSSAAWLANPAKIKVEHEEGVINNVLTDFAPKPLKGDRIIYSSLKSDTAINVTKSDYDYYAKIFTAKRTGKVWGEDTKLAYPPNDSKTHVGNAILSEDEKTMYFTKCDLSAIAKSTCKIFKSTKEGNDWGTPTEVKELNSEVGTTTQPSFGVDKEGKTILYFVSDRGGKGGLDIYYAELKDDGKFGPAKNAGTGVNTPGDEFSPFYDKASKAFYFSSSGHPGLGGLDVFSITGTPEAWGTAVNVGSPVNSSCDDMYFVLNETGKKGFVVSNRPGTKTIRGETCCDDIWNVSMREEVVLKGIFALRNDPTQKPVEGVDASMYHVDGKNFEFMGNTITTATPFTFVLKRGQAYKINGNKDGLWPSVENITVKEDEERDTISQVFLIDPILKKKVKIENIYFEFDKANVLDYYKLKMDSVVSVLMQNPGYSVEVQGHTDSKGSDQYNEKLSQKRAEEAKGYIVSKGITKERVIAKGYGEKVPLAGNDKEGKDDPEGRARNRRVEFKILPDKPEDAPEIEYNPNEPVEQTKTGPGWNRK